MRVIAISNGVAKKGEKVEENKTNFEGTYLGNGLEDSVQIFNWRCPTPQGICIKKLECFGSVSVELQMHDNSVFLTPVKYTLVCHVPRVLGPHDTLPCFT